MKLLFVFVMLATPALGDAPVVVDATLRGATMHVTLRHPDTGWEHYADGWDVATIEGAQLGHRELSHPHVNEQPFTRTLGELVIPAGTTQLLIRAHCLVDGWNGDSFVVDLSN